MGNGESKRPRDKLEKQEGRKIDEVISLENSLEMGGGASLR